MVNAKSAKMSVLSYKQLVVEGPSNNVQAYVLI
jgi:hypothetical protein